MPTGWPTPGPNSVPEYQVSAIPWVITQSVTGIARFAFPQVTQFVVIKNLAASGSINFGFTANGVMGQNYLSLAPSEQFSTDIRVTEIYVYAPTTMMVSVFAGLTMIPAGSFPTLTASNGFQGVG